MCAGNRVPGVSVKVSQKSRSDGGVHPGGITGGADLQTFGLFKIRVFALYLFDISGDWYRVWRESDAALFGDGCVRGVIVFESDGDVEILPGERH